MCETYEDDEGSKECIDNMHSSDFELRNISTEMQDIVLFEDAQGRNA